MLKSTILYDCKQDYCNVSYSPEIWGRNPRPHHLHLNINQLFENNLFCNCSVLISSSYPCHLICFFVRQWFFFFQLFQNYLFPFSGCLVHFQKMLSNGILQKHHLIGWISMVFQIISAKKTILAKLLHLLTGFIGEIQDQISIYICVRYINRTFICLQIGINSLSSSRYSRL